MKIIKKILLGLLALALLLAIGIFFYLRTQKPTYHGELTLDGLHDDVRVYYDNAGVPHIYANTADDAYLALGYVHAQDRLFQMEMLRRAASGRLSEILGPDLIKVDKLFRTLGITEFAKKQTEQFLQSDTADYQKALRAYQKGVNEFIRNGKTPLEFTIIGIPKEEFTPHDIYLAIGFMAFGFAEGFQADPVLQKIKEELGDEYLKDLAVQTPTDAERIKNFDGPFKSATNKPLGTTGSMITAIREALDQLPVPLFQGSNGWAISGDRTTSGFPILANDTHIGFSQPAVWYEAHIEYPGFSFYGHHLAGIPFGLLGNNRSTAWGLTMFENDDTDFFIETPNPENTNQVKFKDTWEDLKTRTEIIKVKGSDDVVLEVKSSRHGPIINEIFDYGPTTSQPVSLWWLLTQDVDNQVLEAAYRLGHASTIEEMQQAASMIAAPGLNVMYADVKGNIAWWAVAKLPIRPAHVQSKLFLDGASGNDEFLGFYDFSKNPHAINPPWGYVYSSNNQPDSVDGVLYPGYYYPKSRAGRVNTLLQENKKWTLEDMKTINLDVVSTTHPEVATEIAAVLKSLNEEEYSTLAEILNQWNGDHQSTDTAPSVYYNILSQIMFLSMNDELGTSAFKSLMETSIPKNSYNTYLRNDASPWWDNVNTKDVKETRSDIIKQAANNALAILNKTCGPNPKDWVWGKIHILKHNHPLGAVKLLDHYLSVGPFGVDGGSEVINNLSFSLDTTGYYPVTSGPALRKITDFGDIDHGETVSPTGQSGNVTSAHYQDQAEMFATGKFRLMMMNKEEIEEQSKNVLLLKAN